MRTFSIKPTKELREKTCASADALLFSPTRVKASLGLWHENHITVIGIALTLTGVPFRLRASTRWKWYYVRLEVKRLGCTLVQALRLCTGRMAHRGSRGTALLFLDTSLEGVRGQRHVPGPAWTGAENPAPPPGFDPWTVQTVASRYTDYATRPTRTRIICRIY